MKYLILSFFVLASCSSIDDLLVQLPECRSGESTLIEVADGHTHCSVEEGIVHSNWANSIYSGLDGFEHEVQLEAPKEGCWKVAAWYSICEQKKIGGDFLIPGDRPGIFIPDESWAKIRGLWDEMFEDAQEALTNAVEFMVSTFDLPFERV